MHDIVKAAVIRLSESLAVELSPLDIRVNTISPGPIVSPATYPPSAKPKTNLKPTCSGIVS
jgi:NAD(P)-dependent dehydrogenase (short-subunit alcohol dehydrogenase family)